MIIFLILSIPKIEIYYFIYHVNIITKNRNMPKVKRSFKDKKPNLDCDHEKLMSFIMPGGTIRCKVCGHELIKCNGSVQDRLHICREWALHPVGPYNYQCSNCKLHDSDDPEYEELINRMRNFGIG